MAVVDVAALHQQLDFLDGHEEFLEKVKPVMSDLVRNLENLPFTSLGKGTLPVFKNCIISINRFEEYIETVERESLLEVLYGLGEVVGLSRESEFAEEWRGDW
ncbi:hypothetical protein [Pseudomonas huanghezhanensis]|uniref:hypothetical protein n=1 Tax=Pseudomonas huanghezhanensis TaxID=3002903 RepID=UPI002285CEF5|nr:hypothetical protein [Pseudomonas sp. BSw22131]